MSSRAKKAQKLLRRESSGTSAKHIKTPSGNVQHRNASDSGAGSDATDDVDDVDIDQEFAAIRVGDLLEYDPRPTFIVDLEVNFAEGIQPIFYNQSFRSDLLLSTTFLSNASPGSPQSSLKLSRAGFLSWVKNITKLDEPDTSHPSSFSYHDFLWTGFTIQGRWGVVSGSSIGVATNATSTALPLRGDSPNSVLSKKESQQAHTKRSAPMSEDETSILNGSISTKLPANVVTPGTPDWTLREPKGDLSPHLIFARSIDWSSTPLGDMSTWTPEFRQVTNLLMGNPHPAALFWGEELTVMYNKAYADGVAGNKHPMLMGTGFRGPFAELWDIVGSIFDECRKSGRSVAMDSQMLPIERHGFLEETFFTWSLTPLYGGTDNLLGLYNAPFETTRQTISDRRTRTLLKLGEEVAVAKSVRSFWQQVLVALEDNEFDFPFALLYSVLDDVEADEASSVSSESSQSMKSCVLEGSLGVPEGHPAAPTRLDLKRSRGGFIPSFRDAMQTSEPKLLNITDGTLSESLIDGFEWRGFGEPSKLAVVCPIRPTGGENVIGFLVVGVNPRRQYDDDYQSFIRLLNRQLATSLASATLLEEELRRGATAAEAAAQERSRLSEELAVQRSRLQRIAEVSPVGMFSCTPSGHILEANDRWYEITGHPRDAISEMSWMDVFHENSIPLVKEGWLRLTVDQLPWSAELQLKKPWYDDTGEEFENWMLSASQPEFYPDGSLRSIMGSTTDITLQKRSAHDAETRARLSEQLLLRTQEAKKNENNFKRFSDLAPGGLVIMDPQGRITYANSQWFIISGHPQESSTPASALSWTNAILEDDQEFFYSKWRDLISNHISQVIEIRMQVPWEGDVGGSRIKIQRWILASVFPEVSDTGTLLSVMGCITDISRIKWAEGLQNQRLKEAEETRRQQNNFIDITSHEMRNPLSAILQCADGISTSLNDYKTSDSSLDPKLAVILKETIESAETIQLCAQHQKSIVDDILTISKLDSNLLLITPVAVDTEIIMRQALKIYDKECAMERIQMKFDVEDSYRKLRVEGVMLDSSRLRQVLVNLLSNAVKFTKTQKTRLIDVSLGAHLERPGEIIKDFQYFPTKRARSDVTVGEDWGSGEILYLRFQVRDTGCGLSRDEKSNLFTRFSQASPRTHVQYGGSGLGLFISRQLTELQGGEIGVASEAGVGSTFAFYVKVRRAESSEGPASLVARVNSDLSSYAKPATNVPKSVIDQEGPVSKLSQLIDSTAPKTSSDPRDWHILIVEDNLVNQRILAAQIQKLGSVVYVANHGGEALDIIKETKYFKGRESDGKELSVILMDLEMPVMNGLTCSSKIREMQAEGLILRYLPIIAVTANARGEQIAAAKDSGMDDVMPKPFRIRQLIPKIEALLDETKQ